MFAVTMRGAKLHHFLPSLSSLFNKHIFFPEKIESSAKKMTPRKENIVIFPLMAQGHIIPFLALALKLEQTKGYTITFVSTPLNIKKLRDSLPPKSSIRLLEVPFNSAEHGLPPNIESTETLPLPLMRYFITVSQSLKPAFTELVASIVEEQQGQPPLCIISDMMFAWSASVAHKFGSYHAIFNAGGGYGMAVFHSVWSTLPHLKAKSNEFPLPGFPTSHQIHLKQLPELVRSTTEPHPFVVNMLEDWLKTDAMVFNVVEEIDQVGLTYFRRQFNCPIYPVGPIVCSIGSKARGGNDLAQTLDQCMKWLDSKPKGSVLYVAFGSQLSPSVPQVKQLAMALEASGKHFIWVARPPSSFVTGSDSDDKDWLPNGFEQRIRQSNQGLLLKKWAPQVEILSHKAIGAFLSHCGWNSVLEALGNGVPLLSWPVDGEQPFNAKMLEEDLGVCVAVANGNECEVRHEDILEKIELVMNDTEKGNVMKREACKVRDIIKNASTANSSAKALNEFLGYLLQMKKDSNGL